MLLFETPQKASFDADVLAVTEHVVTKVNVNGILERVSKSNLCCLENFPFSWNKICQSPICHVGSVLLALHEPFHRKQGFDFSNLLT